MPAGRLQEVVGNNNRRWMIIARKRTESGLQTDSSTFTSVEKLELFDGHLIDISEIFRRVDRKRLIDLVSGIAGCEKVPQTLQFGVKIKT